MSGLRERAIRIRVRIQAGLARLWRDAGGASAVFVASAVIPMVGVAGLATDTTRAYLIKSQLSSAVDAAALAGGRAFFEDNRNQVIDSYFFANFPAGYMKSVIDGPHKDPATVDPEADGDTLTVSASATFPTAFVRIFELLPGVNKGSLSDLTVSAEATVTRTSSLLDVVLAIDVSGSMNDNISNSQTTRIEGAKSAAKELIRILYDTPNADQFVKVGVVPWGGKVNITDFGTTYGEYSDGSEVPDVLKVTTAPLTGGAATHPFRMNDYYWYEYDMDQNHITDKDREADDPVEDDADNRIRHVWEGPGWDDNATGDPAWQATLNEVYLAHNVSGGVPLLAPPPEGWRGCVYARYARTSANNLNKQADLQNAADDVDGPVYDHGPGMLDWVGWMPIGPEGEPISGGRCDMALLNRGAEKYHECTPCPGAGIKPLTNAKAELTGMIDSLFANDGVYTNIPQGLSWAWRMVTPGPPFTESDDVFNTTDAVGNPMFPREKAVVLLTDGANTRRNGDAYNHARDSQNRRNNRTRDIADAIKDDNIFIYTIQFANSDGNLADLMKDVATERSAPFYNYAPDEEALKSIFRKIANNLANLRLTK